MGKTATRRSRSTKRQEKPIDYVPKDARDYGTVEARKHIMANHDYDLPVVEEGHARHVRNFVQVPIDYYFKQGFIDLRQWEASRRLYRLWYYGAAKSRHSMMRFDDAGGGQETDPGETAEKYRAAMNASGTTVTQLIVYNVVCLGEWAAYITASIPKYDRMDKLRAGLDDLAKHFRIPKAIAPAKSA